MYLIAYEAKVRMKRKKSNRLFRKGKPYTKEGYGTDKVDTEYEEVL